MTASGGIGLLSIAVSPIGNSLSGTQVGDNVTLADYANLHNNVQSRTLQYVDNQAWNAADGTGGGLSFDTVLGNFTGNTNVNGYAAAPAGQSNTIPRVTTATAWDGSLSIANNGLNTQGKILVNTLLAQFKRGWARTFIYEMIDQEASTGNQGLYDISRNPKPAATFIHNLMTVLADTGNFTPQTLNYSIPNQPTTVHDLLLQKSGGTFELVIWGESVTGSNSVTVNFGQTFGSVKIYDVTVGTTPTQTLTNVASATVTISDHALILELASATGTTLTDITMSNQFLAPNQPAGTVLGVATVATTGGAFTGTLAIGSGTSTYTPGGGTSTAPPQAQAAGFNMQTAGGPLVLGQNMFGMAGHNLRDNGNGTITDLGGVPNQYNAHMSPCIGSNGDSSGTLLGVAFGGGGYFETRFSWANPPTQAGPDGWPSFWSTSIMEAQNNFTGIGDLSNQQNIEWDTYEALNAGNNNEFNNGIIHWFGGGPCYSNGTGGFCPTTPGGGEQGGNSTAHGPGDVTQPNTIGFLWIPATATSQGSLTTYWNNVQVDSSVVRWALYGGGTVPNQAGDSPFSPIDVDQRRFWWGTGTKNPMTIYAFNAWQKDDSRNIRNGVPLPSGGTGGGGGGTPPPTGNDTVAPTFSDDFVTFDTNKWAHSGEFDDGGDAYFSATPSVYAQTEINTGGHLDLGLIPIGSNRFNAPAGKTCFAGIIDNFNPPGNFNKLNGYWELTCSCDRLPGLGFYCFTLSTPGSPWPPNVAMPNIWTDSNNTMQLAMFLSGISGSEYFISEGTNGWVGTDQHVYGFNKTPSVLELYIDRIRVISVPNPGGVWQTVNLYSKIHTQTNFYPNTVSVNTGALPRFGHAFRYRYYPSRPF
jgi:hypothetical protein